MKRSKTRGKRQMPTGIIRERYAFADIAEWPHELNDAVLSFEERHGVYPNLISGSEELYRTIDVLVQEDRENVVNDSREHPPDGEDFELGSFGTEEYSVEFTLSETTSAPDFLLIYDENPSFDGEAEPVGDGVICAVRYEGG